MDNRILFEHERSDLSASKCKLDYIQKYQLFKTLMFINN